jgi:cytoskeletal protein RodZ
MPEGLSPETAHKTLERHAKQANDDERQSGRRQVRRRQRTMQIAEAVVLAVVTITAAWSGFAAASWDTESRLQLASASTARTESNRAAFTAQNVRNFDASTFNAWFTAYTLDNPQKMAIAERRFRPEFKIAFDAWMATKPDTNNDAVSGPINMPQYHVAEADQAVALDASADRHSAAGEHAGIIGDEYVRITVVLAGVLFLVGIGSTFSLLGVRIALLGVGSLLLIGAVVLILNLPPPA